jgi:Tfp pilus assembly protein FimT
MKRGTTLVELAAVLFLLAAVLSLLLPAAARARDRMAVVGAREEVVALLARARGEALTRGGAVLAVERGGSTIRVEAGGVVRAEVDLGRRYGVLLELSGSGGEARLSFDALGIGRAASKTFRFQRERASASVVVSAYGRVVRR